MIALNERTFKPRDDSGLARDEHGVPLCKGGVPMRFHGYNKRRKAGVWNCPAKTPGRTDGKECFKVRLERCPLGVLCEPGSVMGPLVSLRADEDPRLNPAVPRHSDEWKETYPKRTCTERFFSFTKEAGGQGARPYRRKHLFLLMALCHALRRHAMEWVKLRFGTNAGPGGTEGYLDMVRGLLADAEPVAAAA